jgi:hypothetical protein
MEVVKAWGEYVRAANRQGAEHPVSGLTLIA